MATFIVMTISVIENHKVDAYAVSASIQNIAKNTMSSDRMIPALEKRKLQMFHVTVWQKSDKTTLRLRCTKIIQSTTSCSAGRARA